MDKRYQVFVSSTYEGLREERQEVIQALLELDFIPTGMELFPATDEDSWTLIKEFIRQCDYYIVIVGGRYGSVNPSTGKSYTQMEYEFALECELPALAFLHEHPGTIAADKTDKTEDGSAKLAAFRELIRSRRNSKGWTSAKDLGGVVSRGMASLMKRHPRTGWVRADIVPDESAAQEILRLRKHIEELEKSVSASGLEAPKGTETLATGDEKIALRFSFQLPGQDFLEQPFAFTWNTLIAVLGPILLNGASEGEMKDKIVEAFRNRSKVKLYNGYVKDEDFQQVKIQFRALGLIRREIDAKQDGRIGYWVLTPYGDNVMMRIAAIPTVKESFQTPAKAQQ